MTGSLPRLVTLAAITLLAALGPAQAEPPPLVLATGPAAGLYFPVGGALCRVANQARATGDRRCLVESTSGSEENLRRLAAGEFDLALVQSDWQYHAPNSQAADDAGSGEAKPVFNAVLSLQTQPLTLLAGPKSGIAKLADLAGKRVDLGPPDSPTRAASLAILDALGWDESDLSATQGLSGQALVTGLCAGEIDAVLLPLSHPSGLVRAASERCGAKLIALDDGVIELVETAWPFYGRAEIPGGLYAGNPAPIPSVGLRATLVASADLSPELVEGLVAAWFGGIDQLRQQHPVLSGLDPQDMVGRGNSVDLHEGAIRYYKAQNWPIPGTQTD